MQWWDEMEECSRKEAAFKSVDWWIVPSGDLKNGLIGFLHRPSDAIYLDVAHVYAKGIVQHEILHVLDTRPGHPVPPWEVCAPTWAMLP